MEPLIAPAATDPTEQLRAELHHAIDETDDAAVLQALLTLAAHAQPALEADHPVHLEDLPPAERAAVEEGLRQLDAGLGLPHAEVWAEYEARYGVKSPRWK